MRLLLALSVGIVLADSSVVTLALPAILRDFDASVGAVAWVLIAFNLALAVAAVAGARVARGRGRVAFVASGVGFAVASLACAAAPSLDVLVAARAAQGIIGAIVVAAALELLLGCTDRGRAIGLWAAAGVLGAAVGPALGGFLTEAFSWEAMFALQAPVMLLTLAGARAGAGARSRVPGDAVLSGATAGDRPPASPLIALALVSAALSAALFLLVVMLIEGWRLSPGEAALVVTAMPVAALVAGRWARAHERLTPALPGCLLVAGGLAALGLLPGTGAAWTLAPQLAIGAGLGLALGALIGVTVDAGGAAPGAVARPAAWTVAARHAGIVLGLLALTPIFTADLQAAVRPAERAGLALLLDAPLDLEPKIALARALDAEVRDAADDELPDVEGAFARAKLPAGDRAVADRLRASLEDELDRAATAAFSRAFLAAAVLAMLAAAAVAAAIALDRGRASRGRAPAATNGSHLGPPPSLNVAGPAAAVVATALVAAYVALGGATYGPTPVADPCEPRTRPAGAGKSQLILLATLDGGACKLRLQRETLLLSLLDGKRPPGVTDDRLSGALEAGVDRAQREGAVSGLGAFGLKLALKTGGPLALIKRLIE